MIEHGRKSGIILITDFLTMLNPKNMNTVPSIMLGSQLYYYDLEGFDSAAERFRIAQRDEYSAEFLHNGIKYLVVVARISEDTKSIKAIAVVPCARYPDITPVSNLELLKLMREMRDTSDSDYRDYLSARKIFAQLGLCGVAATDYEKEESGIVFRGTDFVDRGGEPQVDDFFSRKEGAADWGWHNDVGILFKVV